MGERRVGGRRPFAAAVGAGQALHARNGRLGEHVLLLIERL